ncbi:unnamed protein product [Arctia plantaginis]|uniref:Uncharacterized protein n=1 Tax=Arctia plantaginis TaxID=874455 RepID=A0A8S1AHA2_ARCPL|nr:unnamed protein product [Arctia plantaginis]
MRRNRNTNLGGGGGNLNRSSDLFLTDHLKDIDLELDLLKRKREMLEQQQQLIQPLMGQRSFNQQPYYQLEPKQSGSNRDFSHLYNDGSREYRKPYGRKRQSDSDWLHDSYPKRSSGQGQRGSSFAGPSSTRNQRSYGGQNQQPRSTPKQYGQGKQFIGQRINNQKQQRPSKNFVPNKVTKASKAFVPPNKLASQPVAGRSKLVAAAVMSTAEVETQDREALRLLPDQVPTKQMTGRLELALGAILRNIRDMCAESSHHEILRTSSLQRVIKQAIRERVRSAMLGKIVGATQEIVKEYRAMYPKDTDLEIMNIALEAGGIKPEKDPKPIVLQKDRPEEYYKVNMIKLIDTHLHEIFDKIEKIYEAENEKENSQEGAGENNNMETNNEPDGEKGEKSVEDTLKENEAINNEAEAEKSNNIEAENNENNEAASGVNAHDVGGENNPAPNNENNPAPNNENITVTNHESVANGDNEDGEPLFPQANEYKRLLPRLLKRHIPTILKLLHLNKMYRRAVADIVTTTKAKFVEYEKPENSARGESSEVSQTPKKFPGPYVVLPYYVKVMGKPQLPKKKAMNTFLEAFNPKSIKKHRTIHNLLFIGFTEKADFDAIVQADGTVIGRSTLSIRICDKNNGKRDEKAQNGTLSSASNQNVSQVQETLDTSLDKKNVKKELENSEDLAKELNENIIDLIESIENNGIKSENPKDEKANENIEEAAEQTKCKDEVVNSNEVVGDTNEVVGDTDEVVGDTDEVVGGTDEVVGDSNTAEGNSEPVVGDSDEVPEGTDELPTDTEKTENSEEKQPLVDEKNDQLTQLKSTGGRATPTRTSTRLANTPATPSTIRTRRASRLMQN